MQRITLVLKKITALGHTVPSSPHQRGMSAIAINQRFHTASTFFCRLAIRPELCVKYVSLDGRPLGQGVVTLAFFEQA